VFTKNLFPEAEKKRRKIRESQPRSTTWYMLDASFLIGLLINPEDGNEMFLRIVSWLLWDYTALYPIR
jgi:hypothetical protein